MPRGVEGGGAIGWLVLQGLEGVGAVGWLAHRRIGALVWWFGGWGRVFFFKPCQLKFSVSVLVCSRSLLACGLAGRMTCSPQAIKNVNEVIGPAIKGFDPTDQRGLDNLMIELDGTDNKTNLGANAILGVSLAASKVRIAAEGSQRQSQLGGCITTGRW